MIEADGYEQAPRSAERVQCSRRQPRRLSLIRGRVPQHRGKRHSEQIRLDICFGNLLDPGESASGSSTSADRPVSRSAGRLTYNPQTVNGNLITSPLQTSAGIADVYVMMVRFRYTFQ